eukprot:SAG22_NODE_2277_length_2762_cov_2.747278_2_plen_182_part_00
MLRTLWETAKCCPRCNVVLQRSAGCDHFYCICGHSFNYLAAPRAAGGGNKNYGRVLDMAEDRSMGMANATKINGNARAYRGAIRLQARLGISFDAACELVGKARAGDGAAISRIQGSRRNWTPPAAVEAVDEAVVQEIDEDGFQLVMKRGTRRAAARQRTWKQPFWCCNAEPVAAAGAAAA